MNHPISSEDEEKSFLVPNCHPRKKRKLNNHQSQSQNIESSNSLNVLQEIDDNTNNRNNEPLFINPGSITRLKLINFLCHEHFEIVFHPNINIISGQNGSGKSAIEAGISMGLGLNVKKTKRGNKINDVIKFNCDYATIRLHLFNGGPEGLPDYGNEIIIERRLVKQVLKNGTSSFKIYDSYVRKIGSGIKIVKDICNKLNICCDNPCVILKQDVAKQFLNSSRPHDKFKFFMQSSKLHAFEILLLQSINDVNEAKEKQKQNKHSFNIIREKYIEYKNKYQILIDIQNEKLKRKYYIKCEKWYKYNDKYEKINQYKLELNRIQNRINKGNQQLNKERDYIKLNKIKLNNLKQKSEQKIQNMDKYKIPINRLKNENNQIETERKCNTIKVNSKQKFINNSLKKIRNYKKELNQCINLMENNENDKKLANIKFELNKCNEILKENRVNISELQNKLKDLIEIKLKLNQEEFDNKSKELNHINNEIKTLRNNLKQLNSRNRNKSELFCPKNAAFKGINVRRIKALIQYHRKKFDRPPIGPIGEYIQVKEFKDNSIDNKQIVQIVQSVLGESLFNFLCSTSKDQVLFKNICLKNLGIIIPSVQYKYNHKMYKIFNNPFKYYKSNDGPLLRVSDLFSIKDNNAWIYNTLLTYCKFEKVYAHGTLLVAKSFLSKLNRNQLKNINYLLTYNCNTNGNRSGGSNIYKISRRGKSISSLPVRQMEPLLMSDTTKLKNYYQNKLNEIFNNKNIFENDNNILKNDIKNQKKEINLHKKQLNKLKKDIKNIESKINKLSKEKIEIEDDDLNNNNNELQERLDEYRNNIDDEESNINELNDEIKPFIEKDRILLNKLSQNKSKLDQIEKELKNEQELMQEEYAEYQLLADKILKKQKKIQKVPIKLKQIETKKINCENVIKNNEMILNELKRDAIEYCGNNEIITADKYPINDKTRRKFLLKDLISERKRIEANIEEFDNNNGMNEDEIRERYNNIKPKYETHQERVRITNKNVDALSLLLNNRRKHYKNMKQSISSSISKEFKYFMQLQGHDGELNINFEDKVLNISTHMSSHDGRSQFVSNTKTLSGGERSYTQIALIMALQKFNESPFCLYDEFDVFMDNINRGNTLKLLLKVAFGDILRDQQRKQQLSNNNNNNKEETNDSRQYMFITPNDIAPIIQNITKGNQDKVKIFQLKPPRPNNNNNNNNNNNI